MKPDYSVPTMKEVDEVRGTNGYKVISTFSGCGGACLGFEMDGYEILYANEFVEAARDTYAANHPGVILDPRDIRTVTGEDILRQVGMSKGEVDVLEGSPPCASFSTAGSREKAWGKVKQYSDTRQRADDLFFEYTRLVGEIKPKVFTAENVSGLVKGKAIGYFKEIIREMRSHGYEVAAKVLDASYLGVPQARQRLIFVGVRQDIADKYDIHPMFPKRLSHVYTMSDVLNMGSDVSNFIVLKRGKNGELRQIGSKEPLPTLAAMGLSNVRPEQAWVMLPFANDPETGENLSVQKQIAAAGMSFTHERRKFTLQEIRTLSSFPQDFILTGNYAQRWERIGRSVPPLMARAIAQTIRTEILDHITD